MKDDGHGKEGHESAYFIPEYDSERGEAEITIRKLKERIRSLEEELRDKRKKNNTSTSSTTATAAAGAAGGGHEVKEKGLVHPMSFRPSRIGDSPTGFHRKVHRKSCESLSPTETCRSILDCKETDSLELDYCTFKRGVLARPEWAKKRQVRKGQSKDNNSSSSNNNNKKKNSSTSVKGKIGKWPLKRQVAHAAQGSGPEEKAFIVVNSEELVEHYSKVSMVGDVMKRCKKLRWRKKMNSSPLTERFSTISLPRVTLSALEEVLAPDSSGPISLRIIQEYKEVEDWGDLEFDTIWANKAGLAHWGLDNLQTFIDFADMRSRKVKFVHYILAACNQASLENLDIQPTRHMYYHYGSESGVKKEANILILQITPLLVEVKGKIYYGLLYEHDAPQKYPREVMDAVTRSHTVFRYTETAMTIFTEDGIILQQNPLSCTLFGIVASENTMYSDFQKDGQPVDRLRALFGTHQYFYENMWATIEKGEVWSKRMQLSESNLKPTPCDPQTGPSSSASAMDESPDYSRLLSELGEASSSDKQTWFHVVFYKFSDPADGKTAVFCEMKNVHKVVLQEKKLKEARKNEHELLQSIIPKHVIDHLLEEKLESQQKEKSNVFSRSVSFVRTSSFSSENSEKYLDMSILRMNSDSRVSAMAEHHSKVTVCFVDIVDFTKMASFSSPGDIMIMLNRLFTLFDDISEYHNIYKVETIGDAYMCVAGLGLIANNERMMDKDSPQAHASRMLSFARDVLSNAKTVTSPQNTPVEVRIGLHTGDVVTGVVGYKMPRFCLFGDTVNVASRMESTGRAGHIHASQATRDLVPDEHWIATGGVEVKGKGVIESFILGSQTVFPSPTGLF